MKIYELTEESGNPEDAYVLGLFSTEQQAKDYWNAYVADYPVTERANFHSSIREVNLDPVFVSNFEREKATYGRQFANAFDRGDIHWCNTLRRDWEYWWGDRHPWPFGDNPNNNNEENK